VNVSENVRLQKIRDKSNGYPHISGMLTSKFLKYYRKTANY